jgi:hypothetical protein
VAQATILIKQFRLDRILNNPSLHGSSQVMSNIFMTLLFTTVMSCCLIVYAVWLAQTSDILSITDLDQDVVGSIRLPYCNFTSPALYAILGYLSLLLVLQVALVFSIEFTVVDVNSSDYSEKSLTAGMVVLQPFCVVIFLLIVILTNSWFLLVTAKTFDLFLSTAMILLGVVQSVWDVIKDRRLIAKNSKDKGATIIDDSSSGSRSDTRSGGDGRHSTFSSQSPPNRKLTNSLKGGTAAAALSSKGDEDVKNGSIQRFVRSESKDKCALEMTNDAKRLSDRDRERGILQTTNGQDHASAKNENGQEKPAKVERREAGSGEPKIVINSTDIIKHGAPGPTYAVTSPQGGGLDAAFERVRLSQEKEKKEKGADAEVAVRDSSLPLPSSDSDVGTSTVMTHTPKSPKVDDVKTPPTVDTAHVMDDNEETGDTTSVSSAAVKLDVV